MGAKRGNFSKKATLSDFSRMNSVSGSENRIIINQAMSRKVGEFVTTLGPVRGVCRSPAISLRLLNESQTNFPAIRQRRHYGL